jgi:hypothetical protein
MMIPPELHRMLACIAKRRVAGPIEIAAALVGGWTNAELLRFGFRRTPDGHRWLAPADWRTS